MPCEWNDADWARFDREFDALDFGDLDKETVRANSLNNAADVPEHEDPVGVAIDTAKMYIDQGVDTF